MNEQALTNLDKSMLRDAENMLRIAIIAYEKGEIEIFADNAIHAAEIIKVALVALKRDNKQCP